MPFVGRSRLWLWATGSTLTVMLLLGGVYAAHHAVLNSRSVPAVPAGPVPPLKVVAATAPGPSYELLAEDAPAGHVVALASTSQPICPPIGLCPPSAPLRSFVVFAASTGAFLSRTPLSSTSGAAGSVLLLIDDHSHLAFAVARRSVSLFSTITGAPVGVYALPASLSWAEETGGAYDPLQHTLILSGGGQLAVLDAASGELRRLVAIGESSGEDGLVLDALSDTISLLSLGTATRPSRLLVYDAATLEPISQVPLPLALGLGPLTPDGRFIAVYERNGVVAFQPTVPVGAAPARAAPAAAGAKALGWPGVGGSASAAGNPANPLGGSDIYVATATGVDLRNAGTGKILASLPLPVAWSGVEPLVIDSRSGSVYLLGSHGQVIVARPPKSGRSTVLGAATAVVLAHSALARFLPFTNQDPPFITPDSFLLSATPAGQTIPMTYWIHYVDFQWSLGPYPGTTSAAVVLDSAHAGGYVVTFRITWFETYSRSHTWVCAIAPDGSVALRSDSGDLVP